MLRVLVVDDELALLELMRRYLERIGYAVETCSDSQEALLLFVSDPDRFQLVVADLSMPQLSGRDLVVKIGEINPQTRVLVCSGEPFDSQTIRHGNPDRIRFLQKPFAPKMLATAVGDLLRSATAAGA
jgi:DNA-binding response OmpR family regulator